METVILTVHLILALLLIGVVLLQRNEGGALLSGGGNMQARGQATALTKLTWVFAVGFLATSITLAVIAAREARSDSVLDAVPVTAPAEGTTAPANAESLLPPAPADDALAPPPVEAPATGEMAPATGSTAPATGSN
jgi:preprotein translocase subunit SecG